MTVENLGWQKLENAAQHLNSDADFDYELSLLERNELIIPRSAFVRYDYCGEEYYNIPGIGEMEISQIRHRFPRWKFWAELRQQ